MSETPNKDNKRNEKKITEDEKKPERHGSKYIEFDRGFVIADNIRKEINIRERKMDDKWKEKWDHLSGDYFKIMMAKECEEMGIPMRMFERKSEKNTMEKSPIPVKPSPMPVPSTSSAMVGWRSSRPEHNLEVVGPSHVSPKRTIDPPLIPEEFRVTQQKFIHLG